jgi:hypothetical protein
MKGQTTTLDANDAQRIAELVAEAIDKIAELYKRVKLKDRESLVQVLRGLSSCRCLLCRQSKTSKTER